MTALASATSQYSDGSEFAMSDLSMLEFVRDLNGQGDNRNTVMNIPFDILTPIPRIKERSLSPEIDLVPSYLLTTSSQLIPTAASSLFNYRSGGNFRKKLSSFGSTLFSKVQSSAIPNDVSSDQERTGPLSPTFSSKDDPLQVPAKRGFVFHSRTETVRKARKESLEGKKPDPQWLKLESSTELPGPSGTLTNLLPIPISDPFLSAEINDIVAETHKEITHRHAIKNQQEQEKSQQQQKQQSKGEAARTKPSLDFESPATKVSPKSPLLINPSKAESKAKLKSKKEAKAEKVEKVEKRKPTYENELVQALTGLGGPQKVGSPSPIEMREEGTLKDTAVREKAPRSPNTDSGARKLKGALKKLSPLATGDKSLPEKEEEKEKEKERSPKEEGAAAPKPETAKPHGKKNKKKSLGPHALVTIDNAPPAFNLPRGRPPLAMINMPKTALPKKDEEEEKTVIPNEDKREPAQTKKSHRRSARKEEEEDKQEKEEGTSANRVRGTIRHTVLSDEKPLDRDAEMQFSPFVVSGVIDQARGSNSTSNRRTQRTEPPKRESQRNESSEHTRTAGSTLLPLWARLPDTLRSGTQNLSPKQRLTRLFNGVDSHKGSRSNTISENTVFLPRQAADKSCQEKPTVQSLGDIFARPPKTATFDQGGPGSRLNDLFTSTRTATGDTHRWRSKFSFGFNSSKDLKVTKPRVPSGDKERKPRGILKSTGGPQSTFPVAVSVATRSDVIGAALNAGPSVVRLPRKVLGTGQQRKRPGGKK